MPKVKNQKQKSKAQDRLNVVERVSSKTSQKPVAQKQIGIGMAEERNIPRVYFKSMNPSDDADLRYVGCDFMGTLSSAAGAATIGSNGDIHPKNTSLFPRLSAIADLFVKYRFKRLRWYIVGESATTQAGSGAFGSAVNDGLGGALVVNTDAIVRNSEGVVILRGWETGCHEVDVKSSGLKFLSVDWDAAASGTGSILGLLFSSIPATPAGAGSLSWSVYLEYDIEFAEAFSGSGIDLLEKRVKGLAKDMNVPLNPSTTTSSSTPDALDQILGLLSKMKAH